MGKLYSIESVMNSRLILISTKDSDVQILCPKMILSPHLTSEQLESWVLDVIEPLTALDTLASLVAKNHSAVQSALQSHLLDYLQSQGIRYNIRQGNDSKPDSLHLDPVLGDVVIYKASDDRRNFGIVTEILEKNMVRVRTTLYGVVQEVEKHKRLLILIFRKSEWNQDGIPTTLT